MSNEGEKVVMNELVCVSVNIPILLTKKERREK